MSIDISVIVPTYNRADLIPITLQTILNQSHKPSEVIVVDDGSKDNTEEVVRGFGSAVRYVRIENSGECRARNVGVAASSSPLIAFCDSDDLWHPDKLKLQAKLFESVPELQYSFTNFRTVTNDEWSDTTKFDTLRHGYWDLPRREIAKDLFVVDAPIVDRLITRQPVFPSTLMMKRSFFDAVGRWNEPLGRTLSVDLEFHLRCVAHTPIGVVAAPVVGIRKHASNFSGNPLRCTMGDITVLRYALDHNPAARQYEKLINEQIILRSANAAKDAFAIGDFERMKQALAAVPRYRMSWKLHVKNFIAHCPSVLRQFLRKTFTSVSEVAPDI